MAAAPDHLVHAFPDNTVAAQEQQKFIGNVEAVKEAPHAAVGDIDNEAAARWNSGSAPFPRPPPPSRRLLSVSEDDHHSLWSVVPLATDWSAAATYQEMQFSPSVGQLVTKGDCLQQATVAERVAVGLTRTSVEALASNVSNVSNVQENGNVAVAGSVVGSPSRKTLLICQK
jgi:hypothetical protein